MLEGIPDVPTGLKGVAAVLPRSGEDMPGGALLAAVTVIEVAEPCGEGTSMLGDTTFLVAAVVPGVLGRVIWEPLLLPDDAFQPFDAAAIGPGFC